MPKPVLRSVGSVGVQLGLVLLNGRDSAKLLQGTIDLALEHLQGREHVLVVHLRSEPLLERLNLGFPRGPSSRIAMEVVHFRLGEDANSRGRQKFQRKGILHRQRMRLLAFHPVQEVQPQVPRRGVVVHLAAAYPKLDDVKIVRIVCQSEAITTKELFVPLGPVIREQLHALLHRLVEFEHELAVPPLAPDDPPGHFGIVRVIQEVHHRNQGR
mmetsp:Transcript_10429/g.29555  ORF Transcript_10429/g.29555 Transcript_10429/m.29555 type:complete len:213 (-) Transcript_10429:579-1217(-)